MFRLMKRFIDIILGFLFLIVLLPIIFFIALFIKVDSFRDPIIYKGKRALNRNETFDLYKFRTMIPHKERKGNHSTALNDSRLTPIGRFLRKFKLDELPQLINVLRGHMSFVGPRPQVTYYTDKYEENYLKILDAKPGITDLASLYFIDMDKTLGEGDVNERYESIIEPLKNELRLAYVVNMSLKLDFYILFLTALKILRIIKEDTIINFFRNKGLIDNYEIFQKKHI